LFLVAHFLVYLDPSSSDSSILHSGICSTAASVFFTASLLRTQTQCHLFLVAHFLVYLDPSSSDSSILHTQQGSAVVALLLSFLQLLYSEHRLSVACSLLHTWFILALRLRMRAYCIPVQVSAVPLLLFFILLLLGAQTKCRFVLFRHNLILLTLRLRIRAYWYSRIRHTAASVYYTATFTQSTDSPLSLCSTVCCTHILLLLTPFVFGFVHTGICHTAAAVFILLLPRAHNIHFFDLHVR
jgi:hypothetical protein